MNESRKMQTHDLDDDMIRLDNRAHRAFASRVPHASHAARLSRMPRMPRAALAACLLTSAAAAQAHDIVLVPAAGGDARAPALTVRYGHPQDWLPVDHEKLLELKLIGADGAITDRQDRLTRRGLDLLLKDASARAPMLAEARYDNGLWVRLPTEAGRPEQFRNATRLMVPDAAATLASFKFAKAAVLTAGDDALYKRPVGHLLEIIPQKNPLALAAGESLPVLVRYNGQPLEGAGIEVTNLVDKIAEDRIERFKTGADGIAQVPLRRRGLNVLAVDLNVPNDGALGEQARALPAQTLMMVATYAFRL